MRVRLASDVELVRAIEHGWVVVAAEEQAELRADGVIGGTAMNPRSEGAKRIRRL